MFREVTVDGSLALNSKGREKENNRNKTCYETNQDELTGLNKKFKFFL